MKIIEALDSLFYEHKDRIAIFFLLFVTFLFGFFHFQKRHISFQEYKTEVEIINLDAKKSFHLPKFYSTKIELEKITINLTYLHHKEKYESTLIIYDQYLSPALLQAIENKAIKNLVAKCKTDAPNEVMIFLRN